MSNDLELNVVLGPYKGLEVEKGSMELTGEEFNAVAREQAKMYAEEREVTERSARNGDILTIDFVGDVNGVPFDGGAGTDYPLELGSGTFIPGFESQLLFAEPNTDVDVEVTFPEDYQAKDLAGKDAHFKVTVKKIVELVLPELDPLGKAELRNQLMEQKLQQVEEAYENDLIDAVIAGSKIEVSGAMVMQESMHLVKEWKMLMRQRGIDPDQYYQMTGMTDERMAQSLQPQAEVRLRSRAVLEAIAAKEGLTVDPKEVDAEIANLAKQYKATADDVRAHLGEENLQTIEADLRMKKAIMLLKKHAKQPEKKVEEAPRQEEDGPRRVTSLQDIYPG